MDLHHVPTSKLSDEELCRLSTEELVRRVRKADQDKMQLMVDHSSMMKDVNKRMHVSLYITSER